MQKTLRTGERARDSDATTLRSARTWTPGARSAPPYKRLWLYLPRCLVRTQRARRPSPAHKCKALPTNQALRSEWTY